MRTGTTSSERQKKKSWAVVAQDFQDLTTPSAQTKVVLPRWLQRSRLQLLSDVLIGGPQTLDKLNQLAYLVSCYFGNRSVKRKLQRLKELGHIDVIPTWSQLLIGGRDQIVITAADETRVFYEEIGIPWYFHLFRRFLAQPATMMDPVGVFSHRDSIINHIFQTIHRRPVYDAVLLRAFDDGVEELLKQIQQLAAGTHLQQRSIKSLTEDDAYHDRLRDFIDEFVADPYLKPLSIAPGMTDDWMTHVALEQFNDLRGFTNYAARLRVGPFDVLKALVQMIWNVTLGKLSQVQLGRRQILLDCCEPEFLKIKFEYENEPE